MELLKRRILEDGRVISDQTLSVMTFLNHGVDPLLIKEIGREFANRFRGLDVTRVLTVESSGIAIGYATAAELGVPLLYARRRQALMNEGDYFSERVPSFTKGIVTDLMIAKELLQPDDKILYIDDFIANGDAARGVIRIVEQSGASIVGAGIAIEKEFQQGGTFLREQGFPVVSLVRIRSLEGGKIHFSEVDQ